MRATELQALARQPRRIAGARLPRTSIARFAGTIPCAGAFGAAACVAIAVTLLLIADPSALPIQIAFYSASTLAGFLAGLAGACQWSSRQHANGLPWRDAVFVGLALAGATGLAFAGLRMGLGAYWPLPPALLLAGLAVAWMRYRGD